MRKTKGFTLVELLVTITIMAILSVIAWNQFTQQKTKVWRQDCIAGISGISQALEEWRKANGIYHLDAINSYKPGVSNAELQHCQHRGYQTSVVAAGPFNSCNNACRITVTIPDTRPAALAAESYLITATRFYNAGTPDSDKDSECNVFYMNDLGEKGAINLAGTDSTYTPGTTALQQIKRSCWTEN